MVLQPISTLSWGAKSAPAAIGEQKRTSSKRANVVNDPFETMDQLDGFDGLYFFGYAADRGRLPAPYLLAEQSTQPAAHRDQAAPEHLFELTGLAFVPTVKVSK
jgi:hypothetical protein